MKHLRYVAIVVLNFSSVYQAVKARVFFCPVEFDTVFSSQLVAVKRSAFAFGELSDCFSEQAGSNVDAFIALYSVLNHVK